MRNKSIIRPLLWLFLGMSLIACGDQAKSIALKGTETDNPTVTSDVLSASADTNTKSSIPDDIKGESQKVDVWSSAEDYKQGFVQFDLSGVPSRSTVRKATLRLWVFQVKDAGQVEIHSVDGSWNEHELSFSNSMSLSTQLQSEISVLKADEGRFIDVDVTHLVQKWVSLDLKNDGFALLGSGQNGPVRVEFYSKEAAEKGISLEIEIQR